MLIASALWGVVRPTTGFPITGSPPKARLKGIEAPTAFWRPALAEALPDEAGELVVDMRSGAYAAAWKPKRATLLAVRAFSEASGQAQGRLPHGEGGARAKSPGRCWRRRSRPTEPEAAPTIAEAAGFTVELSPGNLDVIVAADGPQAA